METIEEIEKTTGMRTIVRQVKEDGPEKTIEAIEKTLTGPLYWMMSAIHSKYVEELRKAIILIKEGKLDELLALDKRLASLVLRDLLD